MDQYELGVAMAVAHLAERRRHADRRHLARRMRGRTAGRQTRGPAAPSCCRITDLSDFLLAESLLAMGTLGDRIRRRLLLAGAGSRHSDDFVRIVRAEVR
jgi:hypothetical protein